MVGFILNKFPIILLFLGLSLFGTSVLSRCIEGDCEDGIGVASYRDGSRYEGEWKDKKAFGTGILKYANGNEYIGEWFYGKANGRGIMQFSNGHKYVGEWKDSLAHGKGTLYDKDGNVVFNGVWIEGKSKKAFK